MTVLTQFILIFSAIANHHVMDCKIYFYSAHLYIQSTYQDVALCLFRVSLESDHILVVTRSFC